MKTYQVTGGDINDEVELKLELEEFDPIPLEGQIVRWSKKFWKYAEVNYDMEHDCFFVKIKASWEF